MELLKLEIDPEFKALIPKLRTNEYLQLESNIMMDGCREAIITWNGIIVDGHNRYEICHRHKIPFRIKEMEFDCREAVIAWICANQLGRRNISEEVRKYLIGMQYQTEKIAASKRNARGVNQYTIEDHHDTQEVELTPSEITHRTATRIAEEHHISHGTVQKYANYSRALDEISKHEPKLTAKILSGNYKISHKNVVELSKLSPEEMKRVNRRIDRSSAPFVQYKRTRTVINNGKREPEIPDEPQGPSVKDTPDHRGLGGRYEFLFCQYPERRYQTLCNLQIPAKRGNLQREVWRCFRKGTYTHCKGTKTGVYGICRGNGHRIQRKKEKLRISA